MARVDHSCFYQPKAPQERSDEEIEVMPAESVRPERKSSNHILNEYLNQSHTTNMDGSRRLSITMHYLYHMLTVHAMCKY